MCPDCWKSILWASVDDVIDCFDEVIGLGNEGCILGQAVRVAAALRLLLMLLLLNDSVGVGIEDAGFAGWVFEGAVIVGDVHGMLLNTSDRKAM